VFREERFVGAIFALSMLESYPIVSTCAGCVVQGALAYSRFSKIAANFPQSKDRGYRCQAQ